MCSFHFAIDDKLQWKYLDIWIICSNVKITLILIGIIVSEQIHLIQYVLINYSKINRD